MKRAEAAARSNCGVSKKGGQSAFCFCLPEGTLTPFLTLTPILTPFAPRAESAFFPVRACTILSAHLFQLFEDKYMEFTAVLTPAEEGGYVALNPETGTTTQGETVEEAVANLREATELYLSEFPLLGPGHPVITMFTIPAHA